MLLFMIQFILLYFISLQTLKCCIRHPNARAVERVGFFGGRKKRRSIAIVRVDRRCCEDHQDHRVREARLIGVP